MAGLIQTVLAITSHGLLARRHNTKESAVKNA